MLKEAMHIRFKDIIDLDYLVGLDETVDSEEKMKKRSRRDRDIFNKCRKKNTGEKELLMQWLFHRKNAFEHERQPQAISILPGDLFSMLYHWMAVGLSVMGFVAGISLAYSFLAYHGAFPVNVTVFISFFILFQVFLIILTLLWFLKQRFFPAISPFAGQHSII
ncbi:MAG: DUF2868 domain-containing protein, partial [Desulfobacteraceae bacterium]|nr:DUF2868 domain-containing protein [Desulfobacteraceae bacterium]